MTSKLPLLTIGIATRNRHIELAQCLNSLSVIRNIEFEIIVVDDSSDIPIILESFNLEQEIFKKVKLIRNTKNKGYIAIRNQIAHIANAPYVLTLDDDASLIDAEGIYRCIEILEKDLQVGAVAISQVNKDRAMIPGFMQPSPVTYDCYCCAYIGYAHILRRNVFCELGGYKEIFWFSSEEDELCKRLLNRGFYVVYLPDVKVMHESSTVRQNLNRFAYGTRNKCYDAIYNEPLLMLLFTIPFRVFNYIKFFQDINTTKWMVQEIFKNFRLIWKKRKPLRYATYYKWYKIKKTRPPYTVGSRP